MGNGNILSDFFSVDGAPIHYTKRKDSNSNKALVESIVNCLQASHIYVCTYRHKYIFLQCMDR